MTVEGPSKDTLPSNSNRELYVTCGVTVRRYLPKILRRDVRVYRNFKRSFATAAARQTQIGTVKTFLG